MIDDPAINDLPVEVPTYQEPKFTQHPTARWDAIEQSLGVDIDGISLLDRTLYDSGSTHELLIKDTSPHEFMSLVPTAFRLLNILPDIDLPDSAQGEMTEDNFAELAAAFAEATQADRLFLAWLDDAVAYGCSYVQVQASAKSPADEPADEASEDGLLLYRHNEVEFAGTWERPAVVRLHAQYRLSRLAEFVSQGEPLLTLDMITGDDIERGSFTLFQDWDYRDHTVRLLYGTQVLGSPVPWPSPLGPCIVRLAFGVGQTAELRDFPAGLVAPWLPIRAYYIELLSELSSYTARILNNPVFTTRDIIGTDENQFARKFYGSPVQGVDPGFFDSAGKPMAFQMPITPLPKEFYDHLTATKQRLDEASHMSDIMRGHQFQQGTSATEAQAIMEVQSQWLRTQQQAFRDAVEQVWRIWAQIKGVQGVLALNIPDQHSLDPQLKLQRAEKLMQLMQFDAGGQFIDMQQAFKELAELLGCSDKLINLQPQMPGIPPGMPPTAGAPPEGVPNA